MTELNGEGEVVSGIAVARFGANTLDVIHNLKAKLAEIASGLPQGVTIESVYDRSDLIHRAIETLKNTLLEESLIVALVCIVFLFHVRSALVAILMLPVGILIAFIVMRLLDMNSNIMSLGGIAIAIGAMVDAAIVMIENAHKHLERAAPDASRVTIMVEACPGSRTGVVLQPADHHGVLPAGVYPGSAGRPPVQTSGVHQNFRDGGRGAVVGDAGASVDGAVHARQNRSRTSQSASTGF